ncbi:MAG: hypothetical protein JWR80_7437 [Bradyrhizobium sp.]|nr:hypothetical protein [Bradyrhizobium sp.]
MDGLTFAKIQYADVKKRVCASNSDLDEQTLADTVEGLTALPDILEAIIRSALVDEGLAKGLKCRIAEMQDRLARLQDRASKRRAIAKDVMVDLDLKKINAPDFTASVRPGLPTLLILNEEDVPPSYWQPSEPHLNRQELTRHLKQGIEVAGATLSEPDPVLSVRVR